MSEKKIYKTREYKNEEIKNLKLAYVASLLTQYINKVRFSI